LEDEMIVTVAKAKRNEFDALFEEYSKLSAEASRIDKRVKEIKGAIFAEVDSKGRGSDSTVEVVAGASKAIVEFRESSVFDKESFSKDNPGVLDKYKKVQVSKHVTIASTK
jgi:hypothetical protein